jgi:hypothetical protein
MSPFHSILKIKFLQGATIVDVRIPMDALGSTQQIAEHGFHGFKAESYL